VAEEYAGCQEMVKQEWCQTEKIFLTSKQYSEGAGGKRTFAYRRLSSDRGEKQLSKRLCCSPHLLS